MKPSFHPRIREILEDGGRATAPELAVDLGAHSASTVTTSLKTMPDAYIVDWEKGRNGWVAVWTVAKVPADTPRPE